MLRPSRLALTTAALILAAPARAQDSDEAAPPQLVVGGVIEGVIAKDDPRVETKALASLSPQAPASGRLFRLEVGERGPYTIELRSYFFDAYLILRDEAGAIVAEEDDGPIWFHARLVVPELAVGRTWYVEACALNGGRGPFELECSPGVPAEPGPRERFELELADAARRVAALEVLEGAQRVALANALHDLGHLHYRAGEFAKAVPHWERALGIREEVDGPEHPYTATTLSNLAILLEQVGDYDAALPLHQRSVAIKETEYGPDHPSVAVSLNNLAALLQAQGDHAAARPIYERALSIMETAHGPDHPEVLPCLNNLAGLLSEQGDPAGARSLHERALAIAEATYGPEHPTTAVSLNGLGRVLQSEGDLGGARAVYERVLAIRTTTLGPAHPETATASGNLGSVLLHLRELVEAQGLLERALETYEASYGPDHVLTTAVVSQLAYCLRLREEFPGARRLYERALAADERLLGPEHPYVALTLNNLSTLLRVQGEYDAARPLAERALAIAEAVHGAEHPATAHSLSNLAGVLEALGDTAAAIELCRRVLAIREEALGPEDPLTANARYNLALVLTDGGELREAWDLTRHALLGRRDRLESTLAALSEGERFPYLATRLHQLELQLSLAGLLDAGLLDAGARVDAYELLMDWKGRLGRLSTSSREQIATRMSAEQRTLIEELRACQARLSRLSSSTDPRDRTARERELEDLRALRGRLERELYRVASSRGVSRAASFDEMKSELAPGAALIDFFAHRVYRPMDADSYGSWGPARMTAWITRADRDTPIPVDLGPVSELEQDVRGFLEDLVARRGVAPASAGGPNAGEDLRALLWDPLSAHLGDVETVFVSPDGVLGTLPFETLPLADGSLAVERFAFVYLQDATSLARADATSVGFESLLSVGGVDFRERSDWDLVEALSGAPPLVAMAGADVGESGLRGSFTDYWGRLPATEYESQVVADMHEDAFDSDGRRLVLQGAEPSEERLKHELERHAVLHLATHGYFQPEGMPSMWEAAKDAAGKTEMRMSDEAQHLVGKHPGLLSGLVCAGANRGGDPDGDDGYLTAEEVGWLELSGAELVVLSACETGLGRPRSGEGLIGLRRAFQTAGAKTVISSLWSVKDESTADLMRDFYKNLFLKGMGRHEALRAAQLAMLQRNRMEHGEALPSTWGAFVLSGEWR